MTARPLVFVAAALLASACLQIAPGDGALTCSAIGQKCPDGYRCAGDNTCWHIGRGPAGDDMSVNNDMHVGTDLLGVDLFGVDLGARVDAAAPMVCVLVSDCPPTGNPCTMPSCPASGMCSPAPSPAGIVLADQSQYVGTCKQAECDGNGSTVVSPWPANTPAAQNDCYTASCGGAAGDTPAQTPVDPGIACGGGNGVCNGKGVCGTCAPNGQRCSPQNSAEVQTCATDGSQWTDTTSCSPGSCSGGICAGNCTNPYTPTMCSGNAPIICNGVSTQAGPDCVNQTCVNGVCTGNCVFGTVTCDGSNTVVQSCSSMGAYQNTTNCPQINGGTTPACLNGACTQCNPNVTPARCCTGPSGYPGTQACTGAGTWSGSCIDTSGACGHPATTCSAGVCSCSASDPCVGYSCGTRTDACGHSHSCTPGCDIDQICSLNVCKARTTTICPNVSTVGPLRCTTIPP